jgi:hypothetical protein
MANKSGSPDSGHSYSRRTMDLRGVLRVLERDGALRRPPGRVPHAHAVDGKCLTFGGQTDEVPPLVGHETEPVAGYQLDRR